MKFINREGLFIAVCFIATVVAVVLCVYLKEHQHPGPYRSCLDVPTKVSGIYNITGKNKLSSFEAFCELEKNGGGWMIIQYRFNGSLSFERNWTDYRNGFGNAEGEHWLGLEKVYQMTKEQGYELLVELKDSLNTYYYLRYSSFVIDGEFDQYRLITLGEYNGTVPDLLRIHSGMKFSTPDSDNDESNASCAKAARSGWWFNDCGMAFLNSPFENNITKNGPRETTLSYSRMSIRPLR